MPNIGGVFIPDNLMPTAEAAPPARPGLGAIFSGAAQQAYGQVRYGVPYAVEKLAGTLDAKDDAFYKQGLADQSVAANAAAPAQVSDVTSGRVGIGRFIAENFVASAPQSVGILAGGVAGGVLSGGNPLGAVAGAIAAGTPTFVGSNVDRAVQEQGGLSSAAAERSLLAAPLQAASDVLVERYLPGAGKFLGGLAATQTGGFLARTAKSIVKAGASEAVAEASQQLGERQAAGIPITGPDAAAEYVNAAVTAFAVGGVLGAAGGIRRSEAHIKAPADVTPTDMNKAIDDALAGPRALTNQREAAPLGLPAPGEASALPDGADVSRQAVAPAQMIADPRGNVVPNTPAAVDALAATPVADVVVDPRGNALASPTTADLAQYNNEPRDTFVPPSMGDIQAMLDARQPAVPSALAASSPAAAATRLDQVSRNALATATTADVGLDTTNVTPRLFADEPIEDLHTALASKTASPEVRAEAQREITQRTAEATGAAPTENFSQRLEEVKSGLRSQYVAKLTAENPAELMTKVYDEVFENQNTSATVTKLAQRVGLLDEDLNPTPAANQIEQQRTAALQADAQPAAPTGTPVGIAPAQAAPAARTNAVVDTTAAPSAVSIAPTTVDPDFGQQWNQLKSQAGIDRLRSAKALATTPANLDAARTQVFEALATDSSNAEVSQTEKLARKMGLVSDDESMDVTPLGRQVYLGTPSARPEIEAAKTLQGLTGPQGTAFEQGVAAATYGRETAHTTFEDLAAYEAGKVWAQDVIASPGPKTLAQTRAIQGRQDARATGTAVARENIARSELTPGQVQQRALSNLLDAADLSTVPDTDVAALRRMVRDGSSPEEVGRALQDVQGGKTLFSQPETTPTQLSPKPVRGQPMFKEMNTSERGASKAAQRVENELAVRAFRLREVIKQALLDKEITLARAERFNDMLDEGKVDAVGRVVTNLDANSIGAYMSDDLDRVLNGKATVDPIIYGKPNIPEMHPDDAARTMVRTNTGLSPRQLAEDRKKFWAGKGAGATDSLSRTSGASDLAFEQNIEGKSFADVVQYMVDNAPSKYLGQVMKQVQSTMNAIAAAGGHSFNLRVLHPGDTGLPRALYSPSTRAYAHVTKVPSTSTVYLKGADLGGAAGVNFQVAAHEMLHAVTLQALDFGRRTDQANTRLGKAVRDLRDLGNAVVAHLKARIESGADLTEFEQMIRDRQVNALSNQDEVLAWGMTNPDMQTYLQSIEYAPRQSVFSKFVDLMRNLLGLDPKYNTAMTELLRVSEQVLGADVRDLQPVFARNDPNGLSGAALRETPGASGASAANRTVTAANDTTRTVSSTIDEIADKVNIADLGVKVRRGALGWFSQNHIDRTFGERFPGMVDRSNAKRQHDAIRGRFASMGDQAYQRFEALQRAAPAQAEKLGQLMALTTEFRVDPDKSFDAHTHLEGDTNIEALKRLHAEAVKMKNDLSRGDAAGYKAFTEFRTLNEAMNTARLASELHSLVALDPELSLGVENSLTNPMDTFMTQPDLADPASVLAHWREALNGQLTAATAFVQAKKGESAAGTPSEVRAMDLHLEPIQQKVNATHEAIAGMARSPYFHLGRFGDYFGSATIRTLENGSVDPKAQQHVAEQLAKAGFTHVQISTDNTRPKFSSRFDTVTQTQRFEQLMTQLQKDGWLSDAPIHSGPRDLTTNYGVADAMPQFVQRYITALEQSPAFAPSEGMAPDARAALEQRKNEAVTLARDTWLEQQPDSAIAKVLTARYTVPGYDPDMIRNFAHRWNVGATSLAGVATAPKIGNAFKEMRSQVVEARTSGNTDDQYLLSDLLNEVHKRDAVTPINPTANSFDKLRSVAHAYYLGLSPAYGMIQIMQVGTNAVPELAKVHGYSKTFGAIRRASTQAFALMKAATAEAAKGGAKHYADVALTETALKNANLDPNATAFMRAMIATGSIDIGQSANALSQLARNGTGSKLDIGLKYASALGLHTETFSRLVTALAAHELHGGTDLQAKTAYATKVVSNSMFDYQSWNSARMLGKQGFAGPITPLLTQFMTYSTQMTEKLYSEAASAIGRARPGESAAQTAERARQSRVFMAGHLTAITALAGTLGLPFASVFAAATERLVNSFRSDDEPPFDATVAWRGFLADVVGKDVGEVVSRGAPRALGFDLSTRVGESDLLPFSKVLGDKRSWREAIQSSMGRATGAAPDMLLNVADAGNLFSQGDVLGGMKAMMPVAFKGPTEAYRMSTDGYVDSKGQKLPMSPGSLAIMYQLLGFTPAEKAEYSEARGDQQTRRVQLTQTSQSLRGQIVKAMTVGDQDRARDLVAQAQEFDQANPAFAVIPSLAGAMQRQSQAQVKARALKTPLGVGTSDVAGQALTSYANINYQ